MFFLFIIFLGLFSCQKTVKKEPLELDTAINLFYDENKNDSVIFYLNKNSIHKSTNDDKILSKIILAAAVCETDNISGAETIFQNIHINKGNKNLLCWYNSTKGLILFRQNKYSESYNILITTLSNKEIDERTLAFNERIIARIFLSMGDDKNTLEYLLSSNKHFKEANLAKSVAVNYKILGRYAIMKKDYKHALTYLKEAEIIFKQFNDKEELFYVYINFLDTYIITKKYKQALHYAKICEKLSKTNNNSNMKSLVNNNFAEIFIEQKNYKQAINYLNATISIPKGYKSENLRKINAYLKLSVIYDSLHDLKKSEYYALQVKNHYKYLNDIDLKYKIYKRFYDYYHLTHQYSKKNIYLDSINQYLNYKLDVSTRTSNAFCDTKLQLINSQIIFKKINEQEKTNKNIALSSIGFILLLSFGGFWLYRNKEKQANLKTQNTLLNLQQNLIEAELSSLNKQLDSHEIKNLLASISPEIQEKAPESYKKMLKLFNLTKASLNSNSITDSIENQLQQIDDYLSLKKSMLSIPFEYSIENKIQNTQTQIPRLLLKNLLENAIKHGIKQQESGGNVVVKIEEKDNFIYISVDDTGKGRNLSISLDSGIGTTTYQKLFATLNPKNKENATFEIIDKQQGTKVEIRIPTHYKYS